MRSSLAASIPSRLSVLPLLALALVAPLWAQAQGYQVQGAYNPAAAGAPPAGAGLGGSMMAPAPMASYPAYQQMQAPAPSRYSTYQQPAPTSSRYPAYQQQPAPKPKAAPAPAPVEPPPAPANWGYPGQASYPVPYPDAPLPAPKPATPAAPTTTELGQDIAYLRSNDAVQDRRLSALERGNYTPNSHSTSGATFTPKPLSPLPVSRTSYVRHTVRPKESLTSIAARYGVSADAIRRANPRPNDFVAAGDVLRIPIIVTDSVPSSKVGPSIATTSTSGIHIVKRGESLSAIAAANRVSMSALQSANGIRNPNLIAVGQRLTIPGRGQVVANASTSPTKKVKAKVVSAKPAATPARYVASTPKVKSEQTMVHAPTTGTIPAVKGPRGITSYRVEPGDTLESLARSYATTPAEIQRINKLSNGKLPATGEDVLVPLPGAVSL